MTNLVAIQWKYGDKVGLATVGNKITEWSYDFPIPSKAALDAIDAEYRDHLTIQEAVQTLKDARDANRNLGVVYNSVRVYSDKEAVGDISNKVLAALLTEKSDQDVIAAVWKCNAGVLVQPTVLDFKIIGGLLSALIENSYLAENTVLNDMKGLTPAEVSALDIQVEFDKAFGAL